MRYRRNSDEDFRRLQRQFEIAPYDPLIWRKILTYWLRNPATYDQSLAVRIFHNAHNSGSNWLESLRDAFEATVVKAVDAFVNRYVYQDGGPLAWSSLDVRWTSIRNVPIPVRADLLERAWSEWGAPRVRTVASEADEAHQSIEVFCGYFSAPWLSRTGIEEFTDDLDNVLIESNFPYVSWDWTYGLRGDMGDGVSWLILIEFPIDLAFIQHLMYQKNPFRRNMDLRPELRQSIEQSIEQKIETRAELRQQLLQTCSVIQSEIGVSPVQVLRDALQQLAEKFKAGSFKSTILQVSADSVILELLSSAPEKFINPSRDTLFTLATDVYWQGIKHHELTENERTTADKYRKAFHQKQMALKEIENLTEQFRSLAVANADTRMVSMELQEWRNALNFESVLKPAVDNLVVLLEHLFKIKEKGKDESYLGEFFKNLQIYQQLKFVISDRIINRFAARFSKISSDETLDKSKYGLLNSIFEYMLVSFGVVAPELFTLHKSSKPLDTIVIDKTEEEIKEIYQKYRIPTGEPFFWNRWAILGCRPSRITDNMLRDLMRQFQDEEGNKLLEVIKGQKVFDDILSCECDYLCLAELLGQILTDETLQKTLINMMKDKWHYRFLDLCR